MTPDQNIAAADAARLSDVDATRLLDWLEDKATPEVAATVQWRIETDPEYRAQGKSAFVLHNLNAWLRIGHGLIPNTPGSDWAATRAHIFARDPLKGLAVPRFDLGGRSQSGDVSFGDEEPRLDGPGRHLYPGATETDSDAQDTRMRESGAWLAACSPPPFTGRVPLPPPAADAHIDLLFPFLLQIMATGAPADAFLQHTSIPGDEVLARAFVRRVRVAWAREHLGRTTADHLLGAIVSVMSQDEIERDEECCRLEAALEALEEGDESDGMGELNDGEDMYDGIGEGAELSPEERALGEAIAERRRAIVKRWLVWSHDEMRAPSPA